MSTNRKIIFPMIFILLLAELFPWRAAQANTYEVTNTNDSGHGSLRQAITNANNNPGPDTITFAAATNGTPIFLSGAAGENANASGDLDILDGGNLTIEGNGIGVTIIDGDLNDRVLHVCPGGGCSNSVTLTGLTLRNGRPGIAAGGGILNEGAILTVRNSLIGGVGHGNNAQVGGGLCNNAGTTIVDNTTISANAAFSGGGIYNVAPLFVQNGSLIGGTGAGNQALSADGGGIYNFFGDIVIDASTVSANTAVRDGGGIYNQATLTVQNGSLIGGDGEGNVADYNGGGIYNASGTTTLDASTVSDNLAFYEYGGGIYNEATLNIENGSVIGGTGAGNEAGLYGGGIYDLAGTTTVDGSTVSANRAINGGGIYNGGTLTIRNGSLIGGIGAGNDAWHGGGVLNNTIMTVENSTISANSADDGGGIYNAWGTTTINGSTISANTASDYGGGIINKDTLTATGNRILNNLALINGGGVYADTGWEDNTSITGSCLVGNSAVSFFNNQPEEQTATGNWWGAATGPNTPGADTYDGNVDASGYLTAPILGCAPDLQVSKTNDTGGNGTVDTPFNWTLTIANAGLIGAAFTDGQTILEDDLPAGPTYGAPLIGNIVDVTNSANIFCSVVGNTLSCTAAGGNVTLGAEGGRFEVSISAIPAAVGTLVNPTSGGNCWTDPNGNVTESDETNNNCPANVVNISEQTFFSYLPMVLRQFP